MISIRNFLLAVVTFGIYWCWGIARKRRYLYSQVEFAGDRFAYHGTGGELLRGRLKAAAVFLLLMGQMFAWTLVFDPNTAAAVGTLVFYVAIVGLVPLAIVGSWRYRVSRSSYRGIRFSFRGSVAEAYGIYVAGILLTVISLGFYTPYFLIRLRRHLTTNTYYGTERFSYDGDGDDLFGSYVGSSLLALPTLGISSIWFQSRRHIYDWNQTGVAGGRFESSATPGDLTLTIIWNYILTVLTLGIASSWATVRILQYVSENLSYRGRIYFAAIQQRAMAASATGEGFSSVLDVDGLGLEL
jgi:uncharacterized membrane protein YjgN (DUF898 family)